MLQLLLTPYHLMLSTILLSKPWVEQGDYLAINHTPSGYVYNLYKSYENGYFQVFLQSSLDTYGSGTNIGSTANNSNTSFKHYHYPNTDQLWHWHTRGYGNPG